MADKKITPFTDDDLKRLKEGPIGRVFGRAHLDALLARLEAAESAASIGLVVLSKKCPDGIDQMMIHAAIDRWRKAAGK